jgi:phage replication O-like protein O
LANPQKENGHIEIANEIVEALMRINLSPYESRVLWFIFRKTYGWQKKVDWIALSQFSKEIGLDRRLVHRAIKSLSAKQIIVISRDDGYRIRYGFQKNYEKWKVSSKEMTVISRDDRVSSIPMIDLSSVEIPTKETITKETITKDKRVFNADSKELKLSTLLFNLILERNPNHKKPDLNSWALEIDKMIRIDKRLPSEIESVIQWCQADAGIGTWKGWQNNILSTKTLREKYDKLFLKMNQTGYRPEPVYKAKTLEEVMS